MMMGFYGNGPMGWFGMVVSLVLHIGLVIGVIASVYWLGNSLFNNVKESKAKQILACRYAKGEITEEEYKKMTAVLD